jgi:hypothetical protein
MGKRIEIDPGDRAGLGRDQVIRRDHAAQQPPEAGPAAILDKVVLASLHW